MKTLIVTGGSRGIGAATARLAGQRGYAVCVNYLQDRAAAEEVAGAIQNARPPKGARMKNKPKEF